MPTARIDFRDRLQDDLFKQLSHVDAIIGDDDELPYWRHFWGHLGGLMRGLRQVVEQEGIKILLTEGLP